ncbi:MAG: hypothetical protein MJZ81_07305 [Bacteroidales bacterium]|nr:hypothetical protein [Bacteroidales bacterium]
MADEVRTISEALIGDAEEQQKRGIAMEKRVEIALERYAQTLEARANRLSAGGDAAGAAAAFSESANARSMMGGAWKNDPSATARFTDPSFLNAYAMPAPAELPDTAELLRNYADMLNRAQMASFGTGIGDVQRFNIVNGHDEEANRWVDEQQRKGRTRSEIAEQQAALNDKAKDKGVHGIPEIKSIVKLLTGISLDNRQVLALMKKTGITGDMVSTISQAFGVFGRIAGLGMMAAGSFQKHQQERASALENGMSVSDAANVLGIDKKTVARDVYMAGMYGVKQDTALKDEEQSAQEFSRFKNTGESVSEKFHQQGLSFVEAFTGDSLEEYKKWKTRQTMLSKSATPEQQALFNKTMFGGDAALMRYYENRDSDMADAAKVKAADENFANTGFQDRQARANRAIENFTQKKNEKISKDNGFWGMLTGGWYQQFKNKVTQWELENISQEDDKEIRDLAEKRGVSYENAAEEWISGKGEKGGGGWTKALDIAKQVVVSPFGLVNDLGVGLYNLTAEAVNPFLSDEKKIGKMATYYDWSSAAVEKDNQKIFGYFSKGETKTPERRKNESVENNVPNEDNGTTSSSDTEYKEMEIDDEKAEQIKKENEEERKRIAGIFIKSGVDPRNVFSGELANSFAEASEGVASFDAASSATPSVTDVNNASSVVNNNSTDMGGVTVEVKQQNTYTGVTSADMANIERRARDDSSNLATEIANMTAERVEAAVAAG